MALNVSSPDTLPPLENRDSACGDFIVKLFELRHIPKFSFEDTRISDFTMITDSNDLRWSKASFNYTFAVDPNNPFVTGDSVAYFTLTLNDPTKDAYAAIWTSDRAGNDTVYQYYYFAPKFGASPSAPYTFQPVRVSTDSCQTIYVKNLQASGDILLSNATIKGSDPNQSFTVTPSTINQTLHPGDSLQLTICYNPKDTVSSIDTLLVNTQCIPYQYPLQGLGVTPIIIAGDFDFGAVPVGNTVCHDITISNVGNAPLIIDKNWLLHDTTNFSFTSANGLPITIPPGGQATVEFCFHPDTVGAISTRQDWGTNLLAPYLHTRKDTSSLIGLGIAPGLNWDRANQGYWVACDTEIVKVNLLNPAGTTGTGSVVNVSKVDIEGPDQADFQIVGYQTGYPPPFTINSGSSVFVNVAFNPVNPNNYATRNASLVAYGSGGSNNFNPAIALTGYLRHSTMRITPTSYDFGTVLPNTPLSTTFWIHNDGDTNLVLTGLTLTNGFTLSGFTQGEVVAPGDSVLVTVNGMSSVGQFSSTLAATNASPCTANSNALISGLGAFLQVAWTGNNYDTLFVCHTASAVVHAQNIGTKDAFLASARIIDSLGYNGASQFTFDDGTQTQLPDATLKTNEVKSFTVVYTPKLGAGRNAIIVYTWIDNSQTPPVTFNTYDSLTGTGLYYFNTLSVRKNFGTDTNYSAAPGDVVTVPIQMNGTFDAKAQIYSMQFTLRLQKDAFKGFTVQSANGLTVDPSYQFTPDPTNPAFVIATITLTSTTPITQVDTVAFLTMTYVVSKDTTSNIEVHDPVFMDNTGAIACWVSPDTIPGTFTGTNQCGDVTVRKLMQGVNPFDLVQVSPDPVKSTATIDYEVYQNGTPITIELYDVLGSKVATLLEWTPKATGSYSATLDAAALASGTYTVRIASGTATQSQQIVISK
jgi:hypothetical protein